MNKRIWLVLVAACVLVPGLPGRAVAQVTGPEAQQANAGKPPTYKVLYTFTGGADGANPNNGGPGPGLIVTRRATSMAPLRTAAT